MTNTLPPKLKEFARELRRSQTDAEILLWKLLRDRRIADRKFRRQHPVPPFVVDFYCHQARLAIELDGGQHGDNVDYDTRRTIFLNRQGIRLLRFWNHEVLTRTEDVLEVIWRELQPSPQPLSRGVRGFSWVRR